MSLRDFLSKAIQLKVLLVGLVRGNFGGYIANLEKPSAIVAASPPFAERKISSLKNGSTVTTSQREWHKIRQFSNTVSSAEPAYSYLSDSMGSTRIARRIGK